jgi:hypothetical protein
MWDTVRGRVLSCSDDDKNIYSIQSALLDVDAAIAVLQSSQLKLANRITGRDGGYSRFLFTNALPNLGNLTNSLHLTADLFSQMNKNLETLRALLKDNVGGLVNQLLESQQESDGAVEKRRVEKLQTTYESKLVTSLATRKPIGLDVESEMCQIKMDCELSRFDLVAKLNQGNCQKKYLLTKARMADTNNN